MKVSISSDDTFSGGWTEAEAGEDEGLLEMRAAHTTWLIASISEAPPIEFATKNRPPSTVLTNYNNEPRERRTRPPDPQWKYAGAQHGKRTRINDAYL